MAITAVLVDDDEGLCECLMPVLHDLADVQVVDVAQTPADAIGLMAKHEKDWELLILDINLRNGSGLAVLDACRKRLAHQEVFVLTNMATGQVRKRCHDFPLCPPGHRALLHHRLHATVALGWKQVVVVNRGGARRDFCSSEALHGVAQVKGEAGKLVHEMCPSCI